MVLLKVLLESAGGTVSLDGYDFLHSPITGYVEVEKRLDPLNYRFRWVDE